MTLNVEILIMTQSELNRIAETIHRHVAPCTTDGLQISFIHKWHYLTSMVLQNINI